MKKSNNKKTPPPPPPQDLESLLSTQIEKCGLYNIMGLLGSTCKWIPVLKSQ